MTKLSQKIKIETGVIISWITVLGAYTAYSYELGYAQYFGISEDFVSISNQRVIYLAGQICFLLSILFIGLNYFYIIFGKNNSSSLIKREVIVSFTLWLLPFSKMILFGFSSWKEWIGAAFFPLLYSILSLVLPHINFRAETSFKKKLEKQNEVETNIFSNDLFEPIINNFGRNLLLLFFLSTLVPDFGKDFGRSSALNKDVFLVQASNPTQIFLRQYDDRAIFGEIDIQSNTLNGKFSILNSEKLSLVTLQLKQIGKVQPAFLNPK